MTFGGKSGSFRRTIQKDLVSLCREKIRRVKAQLKPNLATAITDKKFSYKYISNKRRAMGNLHPLLDEEGKIVTKDEEKAEVLSALSQSLTVRQIFLRLSSLLS